MTPEQNIEIVKQAYADFARGDIAAVLSIMDENIEWKTPESVDLPGCGTVKGHSGVAGFFRSVGETWEFETFEPRHYVASGDRVIALGHYRARSKRTGQVAQSDWVMAWTLRNGKATNFQEFTDTAAIRDALTARAAA